MSFFWRVLLALGALLALCTAAVAGPVATLVFSGNDWGYIRPCPT
jgi:hypothetical protein